MIYDCVWRSRKDNASGMGGRLQDEDGAMNNASGPGSGIDFDKVTRLVDALEKDLARVRSEGADPDILRAEVERLRGALDASAHQDHLRDALHELRTALHERFDGALVEGARVGQYVSELARLLGL